MMKTEQEVARKSIFIGFLVVLCFAALLFFNPPIIASWIQSLENWTYDTEIRKSYKPLSGDSPIAIVDIDDSSLAELGRWPWPRNQVAELLKKLYELGATVVAFDILFSEPEKNIAEEVLQKIPDPISTASKNKVKAAFDYDAFLADSLKLGESVLAIAFSPDAHGASLGVLSPPLLNLTSEEAAELDIPIMKSYISNIEILEKSAKYSAFINSTPDPDGVLRFSPLLLRYEDKVYPSLALRAAGLYLLTEQAKLQTGSYRGKMVLEGIHLDQFYIPTDPEGRVLIPFRGPPFSFPYVSAKDVLQTNVSKDAIANKLIFIGSSATAAGDFQPTPMSPSFSGVEVHASIASGILHHYLPYKPSWGKGATIVITLLLGMFCAYFFARTHVILTSLIASILLFSLVFAHQWVLKMGILLAIVPPILLVSFLYLFNIVYGFFMESKRRKELRSTFGLYVPPSYLDLMLKQGKELTLDGETKEITVLFSDIEGFTKISESLTAHEIKQFLNRVLTPVTQVIFDAQGTIDKYVGDMVMAFWGAPLEDKRHAYHAIHSGFAMLRMIKTFVHPSTQQPLHVRIGINTGLMNVGDMGSQFRRSYTVLGDAVNFGSRLEQICKFYHLYFLVGENTWEQTKDDFIFRQIDKVRVVGKETAVNIYEPICLKEGASREIQMLSETHNEAFKKYLMRDWKGSRELFLGLQSSAQDQKLYQIYLDRIEIFKQSPPPNNWDGTYVFTTK